MFQMFKFDSFRIIQLGLMSSPCDAFLYEQFKVMAINF